MSLSYLTPIDMNQLEVLNLRVHQLAADPASPVEGQFWYNTTSHTFKGRLNGSTVSFGSGSGSVVSISIASANGLAGTSDGDPSAPTLTLTTTVTGLLKGNGTAISAAAAGTDYLTPSGDGSALTSLNATQITSGTLDDARLSANVALKSYVDSVAQGLNPKPGATVATAAALPACTYANGTSGVGATLTGNANGALTVDSYAVAAGDIVLVKNQAAGEQNGLYTVTQPGTAGTPFILTRHTSMDTTAEFARASIVVEDAGSTNANSFWVCTNSSDPTVGTTAITFSQLNGATQLTAGTGITISGNTISLTAAYAGNGIGTVNGIAKGDGAGTISAATASDIRSAGGTGKYSATIGDGASTSIAITQGTHGLASNGQMIAQVFDASTGAQVYCDVTINNSNGTVTFGFATAPASNAYRVVIVG